MKKINYLIFITAILLAYNGFAKTDTSKFGELGKLDFGTCDEDQDGCASFLQNHSYGASTIGKLNNDINIISYITFDENSSLGKETNRLYSLIYLKMVQKYADTFKDNTDDNLDHQTLSYLEASLTELEPFTDELNDHGKNLFVDSIKELNKSLQARLNKKEEEFNTILDRIGCVVNIQNSTEDFQKDQKVVDVNTKAKNDLVNLDNNNKNNFITNDKDTLVHTSEIPRRQDKTNRNKKKKSDEAIENLQSEIIGIVVSLVNGSDYCNVDNNVIKQKIKDLKTSHNTKINDLKSKGWYTKALEINEKKDILLVVEINDEE